MITFFKDKNHKSKKKFKNCEILNKILESIDTNVIIGATSISISLSITGIGLSILPISTGIACTLSLVNKIIHKMVINKYKTSKKYTKKTNKLLKISINCTGYLYTII